MKFHSLLQNIARFFHWLWSGIFHILTLIITIITVLYLTKIITCYSNVVAFVMTFVGLFFIFHQLLLDAKDFADQKPNTPLNWIKSYPKNKTIHLNTGGIIMTTGNVHAYIKGVISNDDNLEKKVEYLLREVQNLHSSIEHTDQRIDEVDKQVKDKTFDLRNDIEALNHSLKILLAGHVIGSFDITLFGIISTIGGTLIQFFCS